MKPEKGDLNIFFDKDEVTSSESQQLLIIVNVAIGLANLKLIKNNSLSRYESLKFSYFGYLKSTSRGITKSFFNDIRSDYRYNFNYINERFDRIKSLLRNEKYSSNEAISLINDIYEHFWDYTRPLGNFTNNAEARFMIENLRYNTFEEDFDLQDFSDWLDSESNNRTSKISLATTRNSLEYEIKFILIWGLQNHDLIKDLSLLAFDYLLTLIKRPNKNQSPIKVPELPENFAKTIRNFDEIIFEVDEENRTMKLQLKKRK